MGPCEHVDRDFMWKPWAQMAAVADPPPAMGHAMSLAVMMIGSVGPCDPIDKDIIANNTVALLLAMGQCDVIGSDDDWFYGPM
jgi:hypothetical protein